MGIEFDYIPGQSPLDEVETEGLLIPTITTRGELDEFEQQNIEQAILWSMQRRVTKDQLFTEGFVREVHRRMFLEVWAWAGKFRDTNKNIGVDRLHIATQLKGLLDDTRYWIDHQIYPSDEIAVRFKHRLVSIHCFPNGNGRHSRLMADIIVEKIFRRPVFTWGAGDLVSAGDSRTLYIQAVKAADTGNMVLLLEFARS
jgi:Fic-DOC domain mobile mystery protein B